MTKPRFIRPGRTWMITRRTTRRHFLLRPDADGTMQQIYWYTTAVVAAKFGILVHALQVLSTHVHEVVTDVHGNLPAFVRDRNRALANALKRHRGWPEEVFQRAPASYVELYGADAVIHHIAYTLANCVEAGLVRDPRQWPGPTVAPEDMGRRVVEVQRPSVYFDPTNPVWPDEASLPITMPAALEERYGSGAREAVRRRVDDAVAAARDVARKAGRVFSSIANLLRVPFSKRSTSPDGARGGDPTFAVGGDAQLRHRALAERKGFYATYRQSLQRLGEFVGWAGFPVGSWRWPKELARAYDLSMSGARSSAMPDGVTTPPSNDVLGFARCV